MESDNQGVEETVAQTGRRGGDGRWVARAERTRSKVAGGVGKAGLAEQELKTQNL